MDTQTTAPQPTADRAGTAEQRKSDEAAHVASTARQEAQRVAVDAQDQARLLLDQTRQDLRHQTATQQSRAAAGLRELAEQLHEMTAASQSGGTAYGLVDEASRRARDAASWLESREPGDLLDETRSFARRRPGAFLAIAAGVGVLAGRLSRTLVDDARDDSDGDEHTRAGYPQSVGTGSNMPSRATANVPDGSTSGVMAGGGTLGTAAGEGTLGTAAGEGAWTENVADAGAAHTDAGSSGHRATTGTPSVPPTPGGSSQAPQASPTHTGTGGFTTEDDDAVLRGDR